jgi:hypothetical protein
VRREGILFLALNGTGLGSLFRYWSQRKRYWSQRKWVWRAQPPAPPAAARARETVLC